MMDTDTRANHAKRLMEDPLLIEAFELVKEAMIEQFKEYQPFSCEPVEVSFLDLLSMRLQLVDSVWDNLEQALKDQDIEVHIEEMSVGRTRTH